LSPSAVQTGLSNYLYGIITNRLISLSASPVILIWLIGEYSIFHQSFSDKKRLIPESRSVFD